MPGNKKPQSPEVALVDFRPDGRPCVYTYEFMHMSRIYGDFTEEEESFYAIFASFFFIYEYESSERLTDLNIYFLVFTY